MRGRIPPAVGGLAFLLVLLFLPVGRAAVASSSPFGDWAAAVVAGDWRASGGAETRAFDNARKDVAAALFDLGFQPQNVIQASLRPAAPGQEASAPSPEDLLDQFTAKAGQATGGCLFYVTSHGAREGVVFGSDDALLTPKGLQRVLSEACGTRPTLVVVSACYSGVFVPALKAPNRMVITAARRDRTSFGCGEEDRYPYFDACVLESFPKATDFPQLAKAATACVARKEKEAGYGPPAQPQTFIGADFRSRAPFLRFPQHG